jgi:hypothetical protein
VSGDGAVWRHSKGAKTIAAMVQATHADHTVWLAKCEPCEMRTALNSSPAAMPMPRPNQRQRRRPSAQPAK